MGDTSLRSITIREQGGEIDNKIFNIAGEKPIGVGDEVILFLKKLGNKHIILGGAQGRYYISGNNAINDFSKKSIKLVELESELLP